jgi:hypothetical protein
MLRTTSENDGTDPEVIAFTRGIVTVGELACAVKGIAAPLRIKLQRSVYFGPQGKTEDKNILTFE